jgi:hypothetical protein
MPELANTKCPKCGARLAVARVDHHLAGTEKLHCPRHGIVGGLDDNRRHVYGRHGDDSGETDDEACW